MCELVVVVVPAAVAVATAALLPAAAAVAAVAVTPKRQKKLFSRRCTGQIKIFASIFWVEKEGRGRQTLCVI